MKKETYGVRGNEYPYSGVSGDGSEVIVADLE